VAKFNRKIPHEVKIGAHTFTINVLPEAEMGAPCKGELESSLKNGKHWKYFGDMCIGSLLIRLNSNIKPSMLKETLLHEIMHAVVELTGCREHFKLGREETIVQATSHLLSEVLTENQQLTKLFLK